MLINPSPHLWSFSLHLQPLSIHPWPSILLKCPTELRERAFWLGQVGSRPDPAHQAGLAPHSYFQRTRQHYQARNLYIVVWSSAGRSVCRLAALTRKCEPRAAGGRADDLGSAESPGDRGPPPSTPLLHSPPTLSGRSPAPPISTAHSAAQHKLSSDRFCCPPGVLERSAAAATSPLSTTMQTVFTLAATCRCWCPPRTPTSAPPWAARPPSHTVSSHCTVVHSRPASGNIPVPVSYTLNICKSGRNWSAFPLAQKY